MIMINMKVVSMREDQDNKDRTHNNRLVNKEDNKEDQFKDSSSNNNNSQEIMVQDIAQQEFPSPVRPHYHYHHLLN